MSEYNGCQGKCYHMINGPRGQFTLYNCTVEFYSFFFNIHDYFDFSDLDCDVTCKNEISDKLFHRESLNSRHSQCNSKCYSKLHLHAHRELAIW